jgi:hypothetical protein
LRDYERKTGFAVPLTIDNVPDEAPLPVKITLFRVLQESLANGFRHGGAPHQRAELTRSDGQLVVEVTDSGKGFDPQAVVPDGHLGLAGMRERIEILGGTFNVQSTPGKGTVVRAALPLAPLAENHE